MNIKNYIKAHFFNSESNYVRSISKFLYRVIWFKPFVWIRFKGWKSDEQYIKDMYYRAFGESINLIEPSNFNEKNNWRKLYDRKDIYIQMVDKYKLKKLVQKKLGDGYTIPLIGVWDSPKDITLEQLPKQFVLKANHAGGIIVCKDKEHFDLSGAVKELSQQMKLNYFIMSREWPYKNVKRKIICEAYMGENLADYKNYCFNGTLQYTFVWQNQSRTDGRKPEASFCGAYDCDWIDAGISIDYPTTKASISKPVCYNDMVKVVETMAKNIPFVRVDCFIIDNHVYVGEMTFFPWGGWMKFNDRIWNERFGELQELPIQCYK